MNILVLRVSAIGDVVHTLPSIFFIKKIYPNAKISWVVQSKAASILNGQPFLEDVYILPDKFLFPKNWRKLSSVIWKIRKKKWDIILDFQGIAKTSILLFFLKGKKYGFDFHNSRFCLTSFCTQKQIKPVYKNIIQKNIALVCGMLQDKLGSKFTASPCLSSIKPSFQLSYEKTNELTVKSWLKTNNIKKFIILSPNTTWQSKFWPTESWKELFLLLKEAFLKEYSVLLVGKDFGLQAKELARFSEKKGLNIYIVPKWDLLKTSYLISLSNLLIAPDTGLLHIADLLCKKTIGIFGPTSAKKHGPFILKENIDNVIQVDCPHCYQKTHGKVGQNCMFKLSPEDLMYKIMKTLKER